MTTTLAAVLREHPEIFLSTPKEPTFFSEPFQVIRTPIHYAKLFAGAADFPAEDMPRDLALFINDLRKGE